MLHVVPQNLPLGLFAFCEVLDTSCDSESEMFVYAVLHYLLADDGSIVLQLNQVDVHVMM